MRSSGGDSCPVVPGTQIRRQRALSLQSAPSVAQQAQQRQFQRPQRQRSKPELYGYSPTSPTAAQRGGNDSNDQSDADPADSDDGTSTSTEEDQGQTLEQTINQPSTAAAADHAEPATKKCRRESTRNSDSRCPFIQLPDGGRAVKMALRISELNPTVGVPKTLARTCPTLPHPMQLMLRVDGELAGVDPQTIHLRITGMNAKQGARHVLSPQCVLRSYAGYTVTQLSINGRNTEMTAHLQSQAAHDGATANDAAALAAAAAVGPDKWVEHPGSLAVLPEHSQEVFPPAALLRDAFSTFVKLPVKCVLGVFLNEKLMGRSHRKIYRSTGAWCKVLIPLEYREQLSGSVVGKFRAAAPNNLEVYFHTPTDSALGPTASLTTLVTSARHISAPSYTHPCAVAAATNNLHAIVAEAAGEAAAADEHMAAIQTTGGPEDPADNHALHGTVSDRSLTLALAPTATAAATTIATSAIAVARSSRPELGFHDGLDHGKCDALAPISMIQAIAAGLSAAVHDMTGGHTVSAAEAAPAGNPSQPIVTLSSRPLDPGAASKHEPSGGLAKMLPPPAGVVAAGQSGSLAQQSSLIVGVSAANIKTAMTAGGSSSPRPDISFTAATVPIKCEQQVQQTLPQHHHRHQHQRPQPNAAAQAAVKPELIDLVGSDSEAEKGVEAVGTGQQHSTVAAAAVPQSGTGGSLGFSLEPYGSVEQACLQLVLLLDHFKAPDELMQLLQTALLKLHGLSKQQNSCRRIELVWAQYSIVRSWVERGRADLALAAVKELLGNALAEVD